MKFTIMPSGSDCNISNAIEIKDEAICKQLALSSYKDKIAFLNLFFEELKEACLSKEYDDILDTIGDGITKDTYYAIARIKKSRDMKFRI